MIGVELGPYTVRPGSWSIELSDGLWSVSQVPLLVADIRPELFKEDVSEPSVADSPDTE